MVEVILHELALSHFAHRPVTTLSGDELQRVLLVRALVQEPRLLLLDEPTNHLDLKHQLDIMARVRKVVAERHMAALMAIHDLNLALRFCHRLLFLKKGRIVAKVGPRDMTSELIERVYEVRVRFGCVERLAVVVPVSPSGDGKEGWDLPGPSKESREG